MDISSFLGGNFLTHLDLPAQTQIWHIKDVKQGLVGTDQKVCVWFHQHAKPLGLNKVNLKVIAEAFGVQAAAWVGRSIEVFKTQCDYQGRLVDCIRLRVPPQAPPPSQVPAVVTPAPEPQMTAATGQTSQPVASPSTPPVAQQPVAAPQQAAPDPAVVEQQPVAAPQPEQHAPWEQPGNANSPPSN